MPLNLNQAPPEGLVGATQSAVDGMIEQVLSIMGGEGHLDERHMVMRDLDRAVDRLNGVGIQIFRIQEETYDSLSQGQTSLDLPSQWGWPYDQPLAYNADDELIHKMEWLTWGQFHHLRVRLSGDTGVPQRCAIRDVVVDAKIYLYPYVDTGDVAKIIVPYYARLDRVSAVTNEFFVVLPEIQEALIAGAVYFMNQRLDHRRPDILGFYKRDFEEQMERARCAAGRYSANSQPSATPDLDGYLRPSAGSYMYGYSGVFNVGPIYLRL